MDVVQICILYYKSICQLDTYCKDNLVFFEHPNSVAISLRVDHNVTQISFILKCVALFSTVLDAVTWTDEVSRLDGVL